MFHFKQFWASSFGLLLETPRNGKTAKRAFWNPTQTQTSIFPTFSTFVRCSDLQELLLFFPGALPLHQPGSADIAYSNTIKYLQMKKSNPKPGLQPVMGPPINQPNRVIASIIWIIQPSWPHPLTQSRRNMLKQRYVMLIEPRNKAPRSNKSLIEFSILQWGWQTGWDQHPQPREVYNWHVLFGNFELWQWRIAHFDMILLHVTIADGNCE